MEHNQIVAAMFEAYEWTVLRILGVWIEKAKQDANFPKIFIVCIMGLKPSFLGKLRNLEIRITQHLKDQDLGEKRRENKNRQFYVYTTLSYFRNLLNLPTLVGSASDVF